MVHNQFILKNEDLRQEKNKKKHKKEDFFLFVVVWMKHSIFVTDSRDTLTRVCFVLYIRNEADTRRRCFFVVVVVELSIFIK